MCTPARRSHVLDECISRAAIGRTQVLVRSQLQRDARYRGP